MLQQVCDCAGGREWVAGALLWMAAANSYEDYDGTTIYLRPPGAPRPHDAAVLRCLAECCARLNSTPSESCASGQFQEGSSRAAPALDTVFGGPSSGL